MLCSGAFDAGPPRAARSRQVPSVAQPLPALPRPKRPRGTRRPRRHRRMAPDAAISAALRHSAPLGYAVYATMPVETISMQHDTPCGHTSYNDIRYTAAVSACAEAGS
jgi:hypothetical protein